MNEGFSNYTISDCIADGRKFKSKSKWLEYSKDLVSHCIKQGWFGECCTALNFKSKYSKIDCINDAKKYETLKAWREGSAKYYNFSKRHGYFEECKSHFITSPFIKDWDKEKCILESKNYYSTTELANKRYALYKRALKLNCIDDCRKVMTGYVPSRSLSTEIDCINEAKEFETLKAWRDTPRSLYSLAWQNKWLEKCCSHFPKTFSKWTALECKADASKYKNRSEWNKKSSTIYRVALNNKWLDFCFP